MCSDKEFLKIKRTGVDSSKEMRKEIDDTNKALKKISKDTEMKLRAILL